MATSLPVSVEVAIKAATVRPGDTLILITARPMNVADAKHLEERVKERLPRIPVMVIEGIDQALVYRPDSAA